MGGLKNMDNINEKLRKKANDVKTKIIELKNILDTFYADESKDFNNKLIFFKRSKDKVTLASKYILNTNIQEIKDNWVSKKEELDELEKLFKSTVINVLKISKILDNLSNFGKTNFLENKEVILKTNLDNLRLALNSLKFLDIDFNMSKKDLVSFNEKYKDIIGE
jgi:hypothetical protein